MIKLSKIWRITLAVAVALISSATSDIAAMPIVELCTLQNSAETEHNSEPEQPTFEFKRPRLALTTINDIPHGITPAVRTLPRTISHTPHTQHSSAAVRSIDSTTSATRYGLYNHKILFYAHPRHYYLNGLVRLII